MPVALTRGLVANPAAAWGPTRASEELPQRVTAGRLDVHQFGDFAGPGGMVAEHGDRRRLQRFVATVEHLGDHLADRDPGAGALGDARLAAELTDGVTAELARLGTIGVASHTSAMQFAGVRKPLKEIAKAAFNPVKWPKNFEGGLYENATFKAVHDSLMAFRADAYLWQQVSEATFDNFMMAQQRKKQL